VSYIYSWTQYGSSGKALTGSIIWYDSIEKCIAAAPSVNEGLKFFRTQKVDYDEVDRDGKLITAESK
jgi:hypothetical protein